MWKTAPGKATTSADARPRVRPSPHPFGVLPARWGGADRGAALQPERDHDLQRSRSRRDVGDRRHGPRGHVRRAPLLRNRSTDGAQADHGGGGVRGARVPVRSHAGGERREVLPPHPARRERNGLPEPAPARDPRAPRGLLSPAADGQAAAGRARRRADLPVGVPLVGARRTARQRPVRSRPRGRRRGTRDLRPRQLLHRGPGSRARRSAPDHRGAGPDRARARCPGRRDQRPALHAEGRREAARRLAVHPAAEAAVGSQTPPVRLGGVLPQDGGGDASRLRGAPRCMRPDAGDRRAGAAPARARADPGRAPHRVPAPTLRDTARRGPRGVPPGARGTRRCRTLWDAGPRGGPRARRHGARRSSRRWASPATSSSCGT